MTTLIDLSLLPAPNVIEPLDYETLLADRKARLLALAPTAQQAELAAVLALESEPLTQFLQETAYRELLLRARINDAARACMLPWATGADLDNLGALYGVGIVFSVIAILVLLGDLYCIVTGQLSHTLASEAEEALAEAQRHRLDDTH